MQREGQIDCRNTFQRPAVTIKFQIFDTIMKIKITGDLVEMLVHKYFCQRDTYYGSRSNHYGVTATQQNFKRVSFKIKVKNIFDLAEVPRPNDTCFQMHVKHF